MRSRRWIRVAVGVALLLGAAVGVRAALASLRSEARAIPTTRVKRATLQVRVYSTGELRPSRMATLTAPLVSGTLTIVKLAKAGEHVKPGDIVVAFDPAEQEFKLEQARSELEEAEQQIAKSRADSAVQAAQDRVSLLKARFDVRRAELDVSRNELLSAIDAQKNNLALEEARRRLEQLEHDIRSREASNQAALAVLEEKRNQARLSMKQAQKAIEDMQLRAPMGGLVAVKENPDASGGFFFYGMSLPEFREGDVVRPGRPIVDVFEVSGMEIQAKVNENDRGNISTGQPVKVHVDAIPGVTLAGRVKTIAGLASRSFWGADAGSRRFDASFQLDTRDPRLRAGQTALVVVAGGELKDALVLPRQALFDKDGKPVLYVKTGGHFQPREVKITHRTESQIAIEGLNEGDEVALVNPDKQPNQPDKPAPPPTMSGGGR